MKRFLWLGLVGLLFLICTGCGDTFRPVIIPNPPAFPDPRASHSVMAVADNGHSRGSSMVINVSGDSITGLDDVGIAPVHAVQQSANQALVVNQAFAGAQGDSLTKVLFSGTTIANTSTITLPPDSAPNFVATTEANQAYVSLPEYFDPTLNEIVPSVGVVNTGSNTLTSTIPVGDKPVAIAETADKNKLYVANHGSNSVSAFNTIDRSSRNPAPIALSSPLWVAARSDSQRVYVLEGDGTVATLDTTSTAGPDSVIDSSVHVPGASYIVYDGLKNRLYITGNNPQSGAPELVVVDASPSVPNVLTRVPLPATGVGVAALPDGSRAYAASNGNPQTTTIGTISSVSGDGTSATYTYDPNSLTGPTPQLGMSLTISSGAGDGFDGTVIVTNTGAGTFQAENSTNANSSVSRSATGTNFLPQVTVINTSANTVKTTIAMPAVPAAGPFELLTVCATPTRFRFMMAAGGDSSRVYMSSCDGGNVSIIDTADDTFVASLPATSSARAPIPPNTQPPPQNPVFLIAGP
jgi:DNA-binding beta-propeller fold protein YncE